MLAILQSLGTFIIDLFKSRRRLEAENLFQQSNAAARDYLIHCTSLRLSLERTPALSQCKDEAAN
jgi:hypothetical protein